MRLLRHYWTTLHADQCCNEWSDENINEDRVVRLSPNTAVTPRPPPMLPGHWPGISGSQVSPDWLGEGQCGEISRPWATNICYIWGGVQAVGQQSCVMVMVLYQITCLHMLTILLSSVLIYPRSGISTPAPPGSWANFAPGARLGLDKDRPGRLCIAHRRMSDAKPNTTKCKMLQFPPTFSFSEMKM